MRISVVGSSGSGKSTLAKRLGEVLRIPHVELDAINWQPGWTDLNSADPAEFARRVTEAVAPEAWVTDGNYSKIQPIILSRATHVVWLDYERSVIMPRVIRRSIARSLDGKELWAGTGNTENWRKWFDKGHPIRWSWDNFERVRGAYGKALDTKKPAHLTVHRLRHPREAEPLVVRLAREAA